MMTTRLDTKDPGERKVVFFDFANQIEPGVAIASATVQVVLADGADANPDALLEGAASLRPSAVLQRVSGGASGAVYKLRCFATDSSGLVHLVWALLPVKTL